MSLRDELEPVKTATRSAADVWLDSRPAEWRTEFMEIVNDREVGHTRVAKLARDYGCPLANRTFMEWRKKQWA